MPSEQPNTEVRTTGTEDISLCLSGGGYRAAIYHLGAMRWLNECNLLRRIKVISCVSGGSILGAHLAFRLSAWPTLRMDTADWNKQVVEPFREFTCHDIRTSPVLTRLLPWNWMRPKVMGESLRKQYSRHLFDHRDPHLSALPESPRFAFCATDMSFGVNWAATKDRVGDYQAGYVTPPPQAWTLSRAVAASSCFPPVFSPMAAAIVATEVKGGNYRGSDRPRLLNTIRLTDGGVYDNLGLEPVARTKIVLASDGGAAIRFSFGNWFVGNLTRYSHLLQNGISKLRKESLQTDYRTGVKTGTYWGINDGSDHKDFPAYGDEGAACIASIRTDLNVFTNAEFEILENHGYLAAAGKMISKCPELLPEVTPQVQIPNPRWNSVGNIAQALRLSPYRFVPFRARRSQVSH